MGLLNFFKKEKSLEKQNSCNYILDDEEYLDVYEAADIWLSHGKDEDYMFGYSEEELENAL